MMTMNNQYSAASLYDGGWRAEDRDQLITEYGLTEEEADEICEGLREIEEMQKPGHYFTLDSEGRVQGEGAYVEWAQNKIDEMLKDLKEV